MNPLAQISTYAMSAEDYHISQLQDIIDYAENIAGEWNGKDDSDLQQDNLEERAGIALEIINKAVELQTLLEEMSQA